PGASVTVPSSSSAPLELSIVQTTVACVAPLFVSSRFACITKVPGEGVPSGANMKRGIVPACWKRVNTLLGPREPTAPGGPSGPAAPAGPERPEGPAGPLAGFLAASVLTRFSS